MISLPLVAVPAIVIVALALATTFVLHRFGGLSGLRLVLVSGLATELVVTVILAALLFASQQNLHNGEDRMAASHAAFYLAAIWLLGVVVTVPTVIATAAFLKPA